VTTTRVLLKQGALTYRFLRLETSSDGSLIVIVDRDARPKIGSLTGGGNAGEVFTFVPSNIQTDEPLPSGRFSIHTTGEIHRYSAGHREGTIYIEPLHALTRTSLFGIVSIPRPARLDLLDEVRDGHDVAAFMEIPDHVSERISFVLEIGPGLQEPQTYGVCLNYELYSVVVRVVPDLLQLAPELSEHFIYAMPGEGQFGQRQIDRANAELKFYQRIHGTRMLIFREDRGGAYTAMAIVPMSKPPNLKIGFNRPDLGIELIPYEIGKVHKVRFWICDRGGRNKTDDLRKHIVSAELDAEF
jgi:hypothetical protein